MASLSALRSSRFIPQKIPLVLIFIRDWVRRPQGCSAARRIKSMKNHNDPIGNRNRDLPTCGAVPRPTPSPRTPYSSNGTKKYVQRTLPYSAVLNLVREEMRSPCERNVWKTKQTTRNPYKTSKHKDGSRTMFHYLTLISYMFCNILSYQYKRALLTTKLLKILVYSCDYHNSCLQM